jgi:hypothetical protein
MRLLDVASFGRCVPLDDASPYDPSLTGGGGYRNVRIVWVKTVGRGQKAGHCLCDSCVVLMVREVWVF